MARGPESIELDPDFANRALQSLPSTNAYLDRLGEAEDTLRRAAGRGWKSMSFSCWSTILRF